MADERRPPCRELTDEALLTRFVESRDEEAFRALVQRHAGLVLGVCRRALPNAVDAEDAMQATFLVLAQAAHRIRRPSSLASWLYGVACRTCQRHRRQQARHQAVALMESVAVPDDPFGKLLAQHEQNVTDEELSALPESLRTPIVLRYLSGKSNGEVAQQLGISVAAVEGRLKRGKQRLRMRLVRRGVTLSVALAVLEASRVSAAAVPESLIAATVQACSAIAVGTAAAPADVSHVATHLAREEVLTMTTITLAKPLPFVAAAACLTTLAVGLPLALSQGTDASGGGEALVLQAGDASGESDPFAEGGASSGSATISAPGGSSGGADPFAGADAGAAAVEDDAAATNTGGTDDASAGGAVEQEATGAAGASSEGYGGGRSGAGGYGAEGGYGAGASGDAGYGGGYGRGGYGGYGRRQPRRGAAAGYGAEGMGDMMAMDGGYGAAPAPPGGRLYDFKPRSAAEIKIRKALGGNTEFQFADTPLNEVAAFLADVHKIPVIVDAPALEELGIDTNIPVNAELGGISLESCLRLALRPLELTYMVSNESLVITTPEQAESELDTRVYPVDVNWIMEPNELMTIIQKCVAPDSWEEVGGPGSLKVYNRGLVVLQTYEVHEEINDLLGQLHKHAELSRGPRK